MTRRTLVALLIIALTASAALAQMSYQATATDDPTFPGGLEGERFQMLLESLNTRNLTLARQFYAEHLAEGFRARLTEDAFLERYQWVASVSGGLDFYSVRTYDPPRPDMTTVIARGRNYGSWWAVAFQHGESPEDGLTDFLVSRARVPVDIAATKLSTAEFTAELSAMMDRICEKGLFPGAVLFASGNDVIFERACGEVPDDSRAPIGMDTEFDSGSMNKVLTAVAVARLVEQGALAYDSKVADLVDASWLPQGAAEKVTIHHLLTHTSGLGDLFAAEYASLAGRSFDTVDDYREFVARDALRFEPGTDWYYSNSGYLLLGAVIESVTGQSYHEFIDTNVLAPAGMGGTGTRGCPAGGGYSTARDLHGFTMALATGALVSGETVQRLWTAYKQGEDSYGYGYALRLTPKGLVVGPGAGFPGVESYYDVYAQTGYTVIVLTSDDGAAWPVHARIGELMERLE
jgi:CubicO group peptidase (beta-lactamase class C family)